MAANDADTKYTLCEGDFASHNSVNERRYFSVNSFMRFLVDKEGKEDPIDFIDIYFIPAQTFRNQFNGTSIKPVALLIKRKDAKATSLRYNDMIDYVSSGVAKHGFIPIISFKPNGDRRVYKKVELQKLIVKNVLKEYQGNTYYDSKIVTVTDKFVIDKIKSDIPVQPPSTFIDDIELFE